MLLFHSTTSPFVRKVRVAAIELGLADRLTLEPTQVSPLEANRGYADTVNPLRKIPALVTDDGQVIHDSLVICEFLDALAGGGRILPAGGPERWQVLTAHALADGMCDAAVLMRYETAVRPEAARWPHWVDDQWDRIRAGLAWFEDHPEAWQGPLDLGSIALGCLLGYLDFRYADRRWREGHPALAAWFAETGARPSFTETAPPAS
ncbi:MAG: glutathione S-transferase [Alphaproteobacteria bacterium]